MRLFQTFTVNPLAPTYVLRGRHFFLVWFCTWKYSLRRRIFRSKLNTALVRLLKLAFYIKNICSSCRMQVYWNHKIYYIFFIFVIAICNRNTSKPDWRELNVYTYIYMDSPINVTAEYVRYSANSGPQFSQCRCPSCRRTQLLPHLVVPLV